MIVEDEPLVALDTKALVWRVGGAVVGPFPRVPAALEAMRVHVIDGAILDVNLAGGHSFIVADALAERRIPFIFCTGYGCEIIPPRFSRQPVVEKPIAEQRLIAAMIDTFAAGVRQN